MVNKASFLRSEDHNFYPYLDLTQSQQVTYQNKVKSRNTTQMQRTY